LSWLTRIALKYRWLTFLIVAVISGVSIWATVNMKMELIPDIEFPATSIIAIYPQAKAAQVMEEVAIPVEGVVAGIEGLKSLSSTCSEGASFTFAFFDYGTDIGEVNALIRQRLAELDLPDAVRNLPAQMPGLENNPQLYAININMMPVVMLGLNGDLPSAALNAMAADQILPRLEAIEGVYQVGIDEITAEKILVSLDIEKINQYNLSMSQIGAILAMGQFSSLQQLQSAPLGSSGLTLSDVAAVELGPAPGTTITRTSGSTSVGISIIKDAEANTVTVANAVMAEIEAFKQEAGGGIDVVTIFDQSEFIEESISELLREALVGGGLAILVVFLFLMAFRASLVTAVSIPISILVGFLLMAGFGFTINILTLSAMAIAVGRVIDDSIVVLEIIVRNLRDGQPFRQAALNGAREVAAPVTSATLATVVIFLPLAFVGGLVGEMFVPFALTITFALLASLLVALMVIPPMCNFKVSAGKTPKQGGSWYEKLYTPALRWSLAHRAVTLVTAAVLFVASFAIVPVIGTSFIQGMSEQQVTVEAQMPPKSTLSQAEELAILLEPALAQTEGIRNYQTVIGSSSSLTGGFAAMMGSESSSVNITVVLEKDANIEKVAQNLRQAYAALDTGTAEVKVNSGDVMTSQMTGGGLEITVRGNSFEDVSLASDAIMARIEGMEGLAEIELDISSVEPRLDISIDPARLAGSGLPPEQINQIPQEFMLLNIGGTVATAALEQGSFDIFLKGVTPELESVEAARNLTIGFPTQVKLADIATIELGHQPVSIQRIDQKLAATISGPITQADVGSVNLKVQQAINQLELPDGVEVKLGGTAEMMQESFSDMFVAIMIAALLAYVVIVITFRSFISPIIIMMSLPLASIGALLGLLITGHPIGVSALMGVLMLVGIVLTNAIVLVSLVEQLRKRGASTYDALMESGRTRLRPILMTALTTMIAMVPIALGLGEGTLMAAELAVVVIGGLFSSTLLTLLVIPVLYSLVEGARARFRKN